MMPTFAALRANLRAGLRMLLLRPVAAADLRPGQGQIALLTLVNLLVDAAAGFWLYGREGALDLQALPANVFHLPLLLLAATLIARRHREPGLTVVLSTLVLSGLPWFAAVQTAYGIGAEHSAWLTDAPRAYGVVYHGLWVWWLAAVCLAFKRVTGSSVAGALLDLVPYAAAFIAGSMLFPAPELWGPGSPAAATESETAVSEEVFHAQADIFQQAVDNLQPGTPGVEDLYFVGMAGYAEEDVFMKEIGVIAPLMEERFQTGGRTLLLINNHATATQLPLATATNLADGLKRVGEVMDRDEDVLFLYITTHGSPTHELALTFGGLDLSDLTAREVRAMLDEAGIRWRVVVVSACYSGNFIDELRDDHTLVMTASDAAHPSFGCGTESDFTYFGRALFDEALRRTWSFVDAFEMARAAITQRENAKGEEHSNPQMAIGEAMREKLARMARRFAAPAPRRTEGFRLRLGPFGATPVGLAVERTRDSIPSRRSMWP